MEITLFTKCLFEFIGTLVLVLLGDGVVASTVLKQSKGFDGGWIVITIAWGLAVMCGVLIAGPYSGAHLNPAVSVGLAVAGSFPWAFVPGYIAAQLLGGFCGAVVVYTSIIRTTSTRRTTRRPSSAYSAPCPRSWTSRATSSARFLGTFLLVFVILAIGNEQNTPEIGMGSLGSLPVTMLIMAIGMSLGGTTGYAINPARDLPPRVAHSIPAHRGRARAGGVTAGYPVTGPVLGALAAGLIYGCVYMRLTAAAPHTSSMAAPDRGSGFFVSGRKRGGRPKANNHHKPLPCRT